MNTVCVGYVRVSSDEQVREGISLEAQEAKLPKASKKLVKSAQKRLK